jgi:hypothetical protein
MRAYSPIRFKIAIIVLVAAIGFCYVSAKGHYDVKASSLEQQTKQADALLALGLFRGTDNGYELEQSFTRAQGAIMLLRLLGLEERAVELKHNMSPFEDVPSSHWASKQVTYAKELDLIRGVSDTEFDPERTMTGRQYVTLVLRALGYAEAEPDNAAAIAVQAGMLAEEEASVLASESGDYARGLMVEISYRSLSIKLKNSGLTLIQKLVELDGTIPINAAIVSGLYTRTAPLDPMDRIEEALEKALQE